MNPWIFNVRAEGEGEAAIKVIDIDVFGVVGDGWFSDTTSTAIAKQLADNRDAKRINVRVNSVGGDVFAGVAIYNLLRAHGAEVVVTVVGLAASIASVIAMAGHRTVMGAGSMMFVHNPWTVVAGDAKELRQVAADLDKVRDSLIAIYKAKTGKDAAALRALLDAETLMTAEQAKRNGFADEVQGAEPAAVEARGDEVIVNSVAFARAALPAQVFARLGERVKLAAGQVAVGASGVEAVAPGAAVQAGLAAVQAALPRALTRDLLAAEAPALLAALLDEGKAAAQPAIDAARAEGHAAGLAEGKAAADAARAEGAAAERERLRAIDELAVVGHADLVAVAKYGDEPMTAEALAVAVIKADRASRAARLDNLREDAAPVARVVQPPPDNAEAADEAAAKDIAARVNARRGGDR